MSRFSLRFALAAAVIAAVAGCNPAVHTSGTADDNAVVDARPSSSVVTATADTLDRSPSDSIFRTPPSPGTGSTAPPISLNDLPPLATFPNGQPRPGRPVGLIVCEPMPETGVTASDADFAAGCGDWLMWNVGGLPEFDRTPLLTSIGRAQHELGLTQNLRLSLTDARRIAAITGPTHVAVGTIGGSSGQLNLSYSIYDVKTGSPVGAPLTLSGSESAIRASLPTVGAQIARRLGVAGAEMPASVELSPAELASLGRCAWAAAPPAVDETALIAASGRSAFGALFRLILDDRASDSMMARDAGVLLMRLAPTNPLAWGEVAYIDAGALVPLGGRLDALRRNYPQNYALAHADVWRQRASGTPRDEMRAASDTVRDSPQDPDAWLSLGYTIEDDADRLRSAHVGDAFTPAERDSLSRSYAEWEQIVAHAAVLDPKHETAWERLAEAGTFAGDTNVATHAIWTAEQVTPNKASVQIWALQMFQPTWHGDPASLRRAAEHAAAAQYTDVSDVGDVASALTDAGFDDQANQLLNRYLAAAELEISRRPNDPYAHWHRASILYILRRRLESYKEYATVARFLPNNVRDQLDFAEELYDNNDMSAAIAAYQKVLAIDPDQPTAALQIANAYGDKHRWNEATKWFRIASQRSPKDIFPHYMLGVCYDHDTPGRPADAVSEFQTAMSLGDHRLGTYAYLAESLSDSGHTDQAIHWAKQGVAIYHSVKDGSPPGAVPDATFICAALAYVYQNAGRNADAVTAGEEALAIDPNDVGTNEALGDAYFALGQRHKARIAWQIVARDGLEEDPEGIGHARAMLVKYPENGT